MVRRVPSDAAPYRSPEQPSVPDHRGERQADSVFVIPSDPSIGPLLSAWSNQTRDGFRLVRSLARARVVSGVIFGGFLLLFTFAFYQAFGAIAGAAFGAAGAAGLAAFLVLAFRPRPWCSYVGEDGMSDHRFARSGPRHRFLRFGEVEGLWIARTDHIENGFYRHTVVEYSWRDAAGRVLLSDKLISVERGVAAAGARLGARLAGTVLGNDPNRAWIEAGEERWTSLRRARARAHLAEAGAATFPLRGGGYLAVRPGEIEIFSVGKRTSLRAADVASSSWKDSVLTIQPREGGSRAAVSLRAADVGDLAVAIETMRETAGIDVAG